MVYAVRLYASQGNGVSEGRGVLVLKTLLQNVSELGKSGAGKIVGGRWEGQDFTSGNLHSRAACNTNTLCSTNAKSSEIALQITILETGVV